METRRYAFFCHKDCEYFPCHRGIAPEDFNCLFCYCPLYALGEDCGGNFRYLENGHKDCSQCLIPHQRRNYDYIISQYGKISALAAKKAGKADK